MDRLQDYQYEKRKNTGVTLSGETSRNNRQVNYAEMEDSGDSDCGLDNNCLKTNGGITRNPKAKDQDDDYVVSNDEESSGGGDHADGVLSDDGSESVEQYLVSNSGSESDKSEDGEGGCSDGEPADGHSTGVMKRQRSADSDDSCGPIRRRRMFAARSSPSAAQSNSVGSRSSSSNAGSEQSSSEDSLPAVTAGSTSKKCRRRRIKLLSQSSGSPSHGDSPSAASDDETEAVESLLTGPSSATSKGEPGSKKTRPAGRYRTLNQGQRKSAIIFINSTFPDLSKQDVTKILVASNWDLNKAAQKAAVYKKASEAYDQFEDEDSGQSPTSVADESEGGNKKKLSAGNRAKGGDSASPATAKKPKKYREEFLDSDEISEDELEVPEHMKDVILTFFDTALPLELTSVPGCSMKKGVFIMELRPYTSWDDLLSKFSSSSMLSESLLEGCVELMSTRQSVIALMDKCQEISEKLEGQVTRLMAEQGKSMEIVNQPEILTKELTLKPYQMVGLNWLKLMYRHRVDGILADEMGLGKTAQTIAFLAHLLETNKDTITPHIIIVPTTTIENWYREIHMWCPSFRVVMYYGSQAERGSIRRRIFRHPDEFHILLTTYNTITSSADDRLVYKKISFEYAVFDEGHMLKNMNSQRYQNLSKITSMRRLLLTGTPLQNNLVELMSLLCFVMPGVFVGTESQLKRIFTSLPTGTAGPSGTAHPGQRAGGGRYERDRIEHAKKIMRPFILRRLKCDVLTQLPPKIEIVHHCQLASKQKEIYESIRAKMRVVCAEEKALSQQVIEGKADIGEGEVALLSQDHGTATAHSVGQRARKVGRPKKGSVAPSVARLASDQTKERGQLLGLLFDLRKVANHHLLIRHMYDLSTLRKMSKLLVQAPSHEGANEEYVYEDMCVLSDFELNKLCYECPILREYAIGPITAHMSGKFLYFDQVLPTMKKTGDRVLIFSQFTTLMDIMEVYLTGAGHSYLRLDGTTKMVDRQERVDAFNAEGSKYFIFLLSTKAGGLGINLTAANVVIIHDIDYNPYNDKQAEDRCHRVGQTREVKVVRLIGEGTVEEAMFSIATGKLELERDMISDEDTSGRAKNMACLLKQALDS